MVIQKVVIVEDDFIIRLFIESLLKTEGFDVVGVAGSFDETMQILETTIPDLIMMDIEINGDKDGIDTTIAIHKKHDIPVIYITGNSDVNTLAKAKETNPLSFIFKPVDADKLHSEFKRLKITSS